MGKLTSKQVRDSYAYGTLDDLSTVAFDGQTMTEEAYWRGIHERRRIRDLEKTLQCDPNFPPRTKVNF